MKKLFCLLIVGILLLGLASFTFAETTAEADEPASIQEQLEKLWDFARSILKSQKERAVEKQLKAWKAKSAYVAKTEIYIIDPGAASNISTLRLGPVFDAIETQEFGEELLLEIQRRMPALSALSLDELRERFLLYNPTGTHILDVYAASYQEGVEALELAQAFSDAFCQLVTKMDLGTPVVLSLPTLVD